VTDEAEGVAQPYVKKNKMEYLVAVGGGAGGYKTRGIPHAWLVAPNGKIVWKGHPSGVNTSIIQEHIKTVRLRPTFKFDGALKKANKSLNSGKYNKGIQALEKAIERNPDDADLIARAEEAIAQVNKFGEDEFASVDEYAKAGYYPEAMAKLQWLTKSFKGTSIGERADEKYGEWKKDSTVKAEISGAEAIAMAEQLIGKRKYKDAARALVKVTKGKKYEGTMVRDKAQDLLDEVINKL